MHRATISAADGRFPEAHFDGRRIMEPSIGYALTRLCAQARMRGTGIRVEVDDAGTRLLLAIDAEGRLHTPPGAQGRADSRALTQAPIRAQSDASAPTQALPLTPEGAEEGTGRVSESRGRPAMAVGAPPRRSSDRRRTFTADGDPAPSLTPPARDPHQYTSRPTSPRDETGLRGHQPSPHSKRSPRSTQASPHGHHPSSHGAIDSATSEARRQANGPDDAHSISETTSDEAASDAALPEPHADARRYRGGLLAAVVLTALIACGALLLLT